MNPTGRLLSFLKLVAQSALDWVWIQEGLEWSGFKMVIAFALLNFIFICILLFTFDVLKSGVLSV